MGIRGLSSYIVNHHRKQEFMRTLAPHLKRGCLLIIEAPNMMHAFHQHLGLDSVCGGQYVEFYQAVTDFFSAIKREYPLVRVIVLLVEVTEAEKLDVVKERKVNRLKEWAQTVQTGTPSSMISSCLDEVFHEAIIDSGVETLYYDSEADDYVSALALHYEKEGRSVFILSNDTDFYVTVGITGVISIDSITWSPASRSKANLRESLYYSLPDFLRVMSCQEWMIPVLALLLGNDITPQQLKQALDPVKTEFSSMGRGHFINKIIFYLTRNLPNEAAMLVNIKYRLRKEMHELFDRTYQRNKNRYLCLERNTDPGDIPTPQLKRIKSFYPGVREDAIKRIGFLWSNRMLLMTNSYFNAEDYTQPPACNASERIRSFSQGILLQATDRVTSQPTHVTEITRRRAGMLIRGEDTLGNEVVEEQVVVLYECEGIRLPNLADIQEMARSDRIIIFRRIMHCTGCSVIFSEREYIDYSVSVIVSTTSYWFHQVSYRECKTPTTPMSRLSRQTFVKTLLISCLAVYFRDHVLLPPTKLPSLKKATNHPQYHSVAEWLKILKDTNTLLTLLDLPVVSARRCYDGAICFSMLIDPGYCSAVESVVIQFVP